MKISTKICRSVDYTICDFSNSIPIHPNPSSDYNLYLFYERGKINCEKNGCSIGKEKYLKTKRKKKSVRQFESTSFPSVFFGPVKN